MPAGTEADGDGPAVLPVPVHPERTDDPAALRWYLGRSLADSPAVRRPLQRLVDDGVLDHYQLGSVDVTTRLAPGRSWAEDASTVRAAVQDAARRHLGDQGTATPEQRDAVIALVAQDVLTSVVSPVAASHGGAIELVGVADGAVTVRMRGACQGCPASATTLQGLFDRELRRRLPECPITVKGQSGRLT